MQIKSILSESLTFAKIEGVSKKRVIDTIAQAFAEQYDDIDADALFMHLVNREKLGSTGIGNGIAIPHCRFPTEGKTLCACFTLDSRIDFDAVDHEGVDIVFAMVVPEDAQENHLENLATLATALQNQKYVDKLRAAKTAHALYEAAIE